MTRKIMFEHRGIAVYLGETDTYGMIPVYFCDMKIANLMEVYFNEGEECRWYCTDRMYMDGLQCYDTPIEAIEAFLDEKYNNMKLHN